MARLGECVLQFYKKENGEVGTLGYLDDAGKKIIKEALEYGL